MVLCVNGLVRDCRSSIDNTLELLQSCSRPSMSHGSYCAGQETATGLGRKQSSNIKIHPTSRPHRWALGCLFFGWISEIYRVMTAPQPHWNLICLFFHPLHPLDIWFCSSNVSFALIDALLSGSRECKWEQIALRFFFHSPFFLFFPSTTWHLLCITDIGAHKPRLLAPFAM